MISYQLLPDWPNLPEDFKMGNPTGIGIDSNQHVFVFHRADRVWPLVGSMPENFISSQTILMIDRESGKILNSWGDDLFIMPHGLTVDRLDNIWVTDVGLHQVFKFSHDGKLLMKLGEALVPGNDSTHFNLPTDVTVTKDGSIYVSDGYGNSRVVKFSSTGQYLFEWGNKGNQKGQFNLPHAIDLDDEENIYVADRENKRVQVFNPAGEFIKLWVNKNFGNMSSVAFDRIKKRFVAVHYFMSRLTSKVTRSEIVVFDGSGDIIAMSGKKEGDRSWYHNVIIDNEGSIYITDINKNRIQKFRMNIDGDR